MRKSLIAVGFGLAALAATTGTAAAQQSYCDGAAREYANQYAGGNALGGAAVGGAMGAVGGAILGGIINGNRGAGTGALIGGAGGAIVGGTQGGRQWQSLYNQAFNDCMARNSNARPRPPGPPPGAGAPPAWSREWYQYCSARYRSFNPNTGYFTANGGRQVFCR
ncbi:BA14K family protein [Kaistia algarum]|uniref:BA14K family protein n=1 Tax=Kaistia algarum TaxID=2083279 RepID=UPI00224D1498|nr:BA14K family protein [Kaistia algarum]MCX5516029.1 BA14K family protein [Kaistia algarum]